METHILWLLQVELECDGVVNNIPLVLNTLIYSRPSLICDPIRLHLHAHVLIVACFFSIYHGLYCCPFAALLYFECFLELENILFL